LPSAKKELAACNSARPPPSVLGYLSAIFKYSAAGTAAGVPEAVGVGRSEDNASLAAIWRCSFLQETKYTIIPTMRAASKIPARGFRLISSQARKSYQSLDFETSESIRREIFRPTLQNASLKSADEVAAVARKRFQSRRLLTIHPKNWRRNQ